MIRTRDFLVFMLTIFFLVGGITTTIVLDSDSRVVGVVDQGQLLSAARLVEEYHVTEQEPEPTITASERLVAMRERVEQYRAAGSFDRDRFVVREGEPEPIGGFASATTSPDDDAASANGVVQQCPHYQSFVGVWPAPVVIEEHEGARLVIHRHPDIDDVSPMEESLLQGEILLQLPTMRQPVGRPSCVASDVVGIARDGSLIRNNEYQAYGFFGADTIVGYALDGFPIYGRNNAAQTDQCGGGMGVEGYGYILTSDRQAVLNCFSGHPVSI